MKKDLNKTTPITAEVEELLNNDCFLLWCIAPDAESDKYWTDWLLKNPEKENAVNEAKRIVSSLQFNAYRLSDIESKLLEARLMRSLKKRRRRRKQWMAVAAASLLLLLSLSVRQVIQWNAVEKTGEEMFDIARLHMDESQTEIALYVRNQEKYLLPNEAKIKQKSSGAIEMEEAKIDSICDEESGILKNTSTAQTFNTLKVPNGRRSFLTLSDGSKVWINAGTVLSFPSTFEKDNRTIWVSGEIYVEVAKDRNRPFIIKTSVMNVEALGTSFNVRAYPQDKYQSVVLIEGMVAVHNSFGETRKISPNTRLILYGSAMEVEEDISVYSYISWRDGVLQFEGQTLGYVIACLSRYYNLRFECDPEVEDFVCAGKLVLFNDVIKVMNTLENSFPITCELERNIIKLNNKPKK